MATYIWELEKHEIEFLTGCLLHNTSTHLSEISQNDINQWSLSLLVILLQPFL